jgi:hypothetical protein
MSERSLAAIRCLALALLCLLGLGAAAPARAEPKPLNKEEQAKVNRAIDKAIAFLKGAQSKKGCWDQGRFETSCPVGATAMAALALLEAGVPADDPVVQKAAEWLRPQLPNLKRSHENYQLSLVLLFLDRLSDPQDKAVIRSLALRLIAGQHRSGGWGYECPTLSPNNEETLTDLLRQWEEAYAGNKAPPAVPAPFKGLTVFQDPANLFREDPPAESTSASMRQREWLVRAPIDKWEPLLTESTDNSNTQFAILALWVARRHGLTLGPTFRLVAQRFERSQHVDGTWFYSFTLPVEAAYPRRSMTTVGLLGLALREGLRPEKSVAPAAPDLQMLKGFAAVSRYIGDPTGQMKQRVPMTDFYYLWSLERLAVLYDLPTIGGKDWYRWGAEKLVTNQTGRGDWPNPGRTPKEDAGDGYGASLNTSFALLFLKRSHLLPDLTAKLPYKPDVLEKGIAATMQGRPLPVDIVRPETTSKKP